MPMYWIYNIPTLLLGVLFSVVFVGFAALGVVVTRPLVRRRFSHRQGWREHVTITVEGVSVIAGILLALVTVAVYNDYIDAREKVSEEAANLAAVYRSVSLYPEPVRSELQTDLKDYIALVIEKNWPEQQQGIVPLGGGYPTSFEQNLAKFEPKTDGQLALHLATITKTDDWLTLRRERLDRVTVGLPAAMWLVLVLGSLVTIALTWLMPAEGPGGHILLSGAFAFIIGLLLFITALVDHPFQGPIGVSSEPFELVQKEVMHVTPLFR